MQEAADQTSYGTRLGVGIAVDGNSRSNVSKSGASMRGEGSVLQTTEKTAAPWTASVFPAQTVSMVKKRALQWAG